jgi:hypothetical protein
LRVHGNGCGEARKLYFGRIAVAYRLLTTTRRGYWYEQEQASASREFVLEAV